MKLREPDLILFNMGSVVLGSVSTNGNEYKSSLATILASRTLGPTKSSKQDPKSSQQTKLDNARTNGRIGAIRSSKKSRETRSRRDHGNVIESHLVGGFFLPGHVMEVAEDAIQVLAVFLFVARQVRHLALERIVVLFFSCFVI